MTLARGSILQTDIHNQSIQSTRLVRRLSAESTMSVELYTPKADLAVDPDIEDRISRLSGGSVEEHHSAWKMFLHRSAYSPVRLDDELGWAPRPSDLSRGMDASAFGWKEAFEDLLACQTGRPLMSLRERYLVKLGVGSYGIYTGVWDSMLRGGRLPEAYLPIDDKGGAYAGFGHGGYRQPAYRSPASMEEWVRWRRSQMDDHHGKMAGGDAGHLLKILMGGVVNELGETIDHTVDYLNGWINKVFWEKENRSDDTLKDADSRRQDTRNESELLLGFLEEAHKRSERLDHEMQRAASRLSEKVLGREPEEPTNWNSEKWMPGSKPGELVNEDGHTKTTTSKFYVDRFNNVHEKIETVVKDAAGNQIGYSSRHSVKSARDKAEAEEMVKALEGEAGHAGVVDAEDRDKRDGEKKEERRGFFWKRD